MIRATRRRQSPVKTPGRSSEATAGRWRRRQRKQPVSQNAPAAPTAPNVVLEPGVIPLAPHVMVLQEQTIRNIAAANKAALLGQAPATKNASLRSARAGAVNVRMLAHLLRRPPDVGPTYHAYNHLRQLYVLEQAARHFGARADDPAPLYGRRLLDVGCGTSTVSQFLALAGADITAIDPDAEALGSARNAAEEYGAPVTFLPFRAEQLVSQSERFDVILALDVLEESTDPAKLMWVLRQLLAPGGVVIVSAINRSVMAWVLHIFLSNYIYRRTALRRRWRNFYRPAMLTELAALQGLYLEHQQLLHFSVRQQQWMPVASSRSWLRGPVLGLFRSLRGLFTLRGGTRYLMTLSAGGPVVNR